MAGLSVPEFLILLTVVSVVGRGMIELILVMGILGGIGWSRVVRSAVIGIKEKRLLSGGGSNREHHGKNS